MVHRNKNRVFLAVLLFLTRSAWADVTIIVNKAQEGKLTSKNVYNLYQGIEKSSGVELLNQEEGQSARAEFFKKFLKHSEIEMKQKWSALIFSGNRVPSVLPDDHAVFEYVKNHANAVGYVSADFFEENARKSGAVISIFKAQ